MVYARTHTHSVSFFLSFRLHDHIIEILCASGTVELRTAAVILVVFAGSVTLRLDDAFALGGLVGVNVDRPVVQLDLHHGVHRILVVPFVAGPGSAGARRYSDLPLAARADLTVRRALVALTPEAD
ncbi:hypothetical protein PUN28_005704 [Cardiocondyla obscurior]|uniref:Uncharacterized protein n=1 Tax=Cardiocondyla obscurior TaxID=286306 RepID=A0AAW2G7H1_9HYME